MQCHFTCCAEIVDVVCMILDARCNDIWCNVKWYLITVQCNMIAIYKWYLMRVDKFALYMLIDPNISHWYAIFWFMNALMRVLTIFQTTHIGIHNVKCFKNMHLIWLVDHISPRLTVFIQSDRIVLTYEDWLHCFYITCYEWFACAFLRVLNDPNNSHEHALCRLVHHITLALIIWLIHWTLLENMFETSMRVCLDFPYEFDSTLYILHWCIHASKLHSLCWLIWHKLRWYIKVNS